VRFKELLLFCFLLTIAVTPAFAQYTGGDNDGGSVGAACVSTLDGVDQFDISAAVLIGSSSFCDFSNEAYSVIVPNAPQEIVYYWTLPSGSTIVTGNFTSDINVSFGNTSGLVSVTIVTACSSRTINMPVTNGACSMYQGTDNDGFSENPSCATTLNGDPVIDIAPAIVGSPDFCVGSQESYSLQVSDIPQNTYFNWTVPPGSTVMQGQGTNIVIIVFGSAGGNVAVDVITDCGVVTRTLAVTSMTCPFYSGGDNDGFSKGPACSTTLNGDPLFSVTGIVGSATFCEFGTEGFSVVTVDAPADIYYNWTVPAGATIVSGQGTANITVLFGNMSGDVAVDVITDCATITPTPFPVTATSCSFFYGGDNDGFTTTETCALTLDGADSFIVAPIAGSPASCEFATETYSVVVAGTTVNTTIVWTVPAGATIVSGQGTTSILVAFGNTGGNVAVAITNNCTTKNASLPVSVANCIFYSGGNNDGFSTAQQCASNLDGGSVFSPGPVVGSTASCEFSTESYSISVAGTTASTTYTWTVPAGATIISGQGTTSILVAFGNTSGNVAITIANDCSSTNVALPVTVANCIFYSGGVNDGFSSAQQCASNLNGGSVFSPGPVVGSAASCEFSTEAYSITVAGTTSSTTYTWTVPAGATIISGQGTTSILVAFGNTSGNVAITIANDCSSTNVALPVTVSNCIFYSGGNNDGFSNTQTCALNLNGGNTFTPGPIVGSAAFCNFATESYSITVAGATASTTYLWSVPAGATIVSGQGTTAILVSFGNTAGNVAVLISNDCSSTNVTLAVSPSSCLFYAGGSNDGFSVATATNIALPISLVSFDAEVKDGIVYLKWETSSEIDNDFFMIERSHDGKTFEQLTKIDGAGTSKEPLKYQARDTNPYHGTSYYRLSQTDYDGTIAYFRVVAVKIETFAEITKLYPNPVRKDDLLHVDYFAEEDGQVKISIINPGGISTDSEMINVKAGVNLFEFTPHFESAGVHVIIIRSREKAQALRLVVL
jgi:hypothetical protein